MPTHPSAMAIYYLAGTTATAVLVAVLVFLGLGKARLRRDAWAALYERRLAVYTAVGEILAIVTVRGRLTAQESMAYREAIRQARDLFDDTLVCYLEVTLWTLMQELTRLQEEALWESVSTKLGTGARGNRAIDAHLAKKAEILAQQDTIDNLFRRFLN